jgi:hypothetical protein
MLEQQGIGIAWPFALVIYICYKYGITQLYQLEHVRLDEMPI